MGAYQSTDDGSSGADKGGQSVEAKTCFYKLLEVDPKASEDEYARINPAHRIALTAKQSEKGLPQESPRATSRP